jgi:hypothetical protein
VYSGVLFQGSPIANIFSAPQALSDDGSAFDDGQWDVYDYTTFSTQNTPLGIFASSNGMIVISSDAKGYIYRSIDYGVTWSTKKRIYVDSDDTYASIYGLAMDKACFISILSASALKCTYLYKYMLMSTAIFFPESSAIDTHLIESGQLSFKKLFRYLIHIFFKLMSFVSVKFNVH